LQKRERYVLAVIISIVIIAAGITILVVNNPSEPIEEKNHELEWAEIADTTMIYDFRIYETGGNGDIVDDWVPWNNSQIVINILSVPDLPDNITARIFIEEIANPREVNASFLDGSDIGVNSQIPIESLVSFLMFPVGDWTFVESLFDTKLDIVYNEESPFPSQYEYNGTIVLTGEYSLYREWRMPGSGHGSYYSSTYGLVNRTTGLPNYIEYYWLFSHVSGYNYTVILTRSAQS